jgi:hypothetical protein
MSTTLNVQRIKRPDITKHIPDYRGIYCAWVAADAETAWAARAIWKTGQCYFDLLPDRQHIEGTYEQRVELSNWINNTGKSALNKAFLDEDMRESQDDYILLEDGKYMMLGTPNCSYGYAYLSAWIVTMAEY